MRNTTLERYQTAADRFDGLMQQAFQQMPRKLNILEAQQEILEQVASEYHYSQDTLKRILTEHSTEYICRTGLRRTPS